LTGLDALVLDMYPHGHPHQQLHHRLGRNLLDALVLIGSVVEVLALVPALALVRVLARAV
jgi:hypothetical protein